MLRGSLRSSAGALLSARHMSNAPVTSGATSVFPEAPSPLQEFSVVYTDRALNHMSAPFKRVMLDIGDMLKEVYHAEHAVIIPGSGTYAMEACARHFATNKKAMVLRNGYFSYRWTHIFETCGIPAEEIVVKARPVSEATPLQYAPCPIDELEEMIAREKPAVVFAPHVETSTGILLPDDYIKRATAAVHAQGGLFVLDCIASGTVWANMEELGVDALISAPQKGWTGPSCAGLVMLSKRGAEATRATKGTSFVVDLKKWLELMDSYEAGGFMYHATMPTDALATFRDVMLETKDFGFDRAASSAWELGTQVRKYMCEEKGLVSVAAPGFESPGVVVVHTEDSGVVGKFIAAGTQIAAGVPFMIDEPEGTTTFRIGLFGLDKLREPSVTTANLKRAMDVAVPATMPGY
jgi:aspartate aminotransferase-like enzyme